MLDVIDARITPGYSRQSLDYHTYQQFFMSWLCCQHFIRL